MVFASPIWLIGLAPWAAIAAWLLRGKRPRVGVPFVRLWRGPVSGPPPRRGIQFPPIAIALSLLAALAAIVAAAKPVLPRLASTRTADADVIVDRGITMSALGAGDARYREAAAAAWPDVIRALGGSTPAELTAVPGVESARSTLAGAADWIRSLAPTAVDSRGPLDFAIAGRLKASTGPVLVVTDQPLHSADPRVIQISPTTRMRDIAITALTYREQPAPELMVRVRNRSERPRAQLVIGGDSIESHAIDLPTSGESRDYFFDGKRPGNLISIELRASTSMPPLARRFLVRERASASIAPRAALPPELDRMIGVYRKARPVTDSSEPINVVSSASGLAVDRAGLIVEAGGVEMTARPQAVAHPVTDHVHWDRLAAPFRVAESPPPGWRTLVSAGGRAMVAEATEPPERLWVGFDATGWATTPDFVIFWTNVFDRLAGAGGDEPFVAHDLTDWSPDWEPADPLPGEPGQWPGLYRRADGTLRAFAAADVPTPPPPPQDWRARLVDVSRTSTSGFVLSSLLLIVAATCALAAAALWPRARSYSTTARASLNNSHGGASGG